MTEQDIEQMRRRIDDIVEATQKLRELGEENDVPAVERTAKRLEGTVTQLETHVPPELSEE